MLKKLKHGFTLVELVIVIAVIAVLAAVLIPTFISVIDNANNSADVQLVANMNTVLATSLDGGSNATAESLHKLMKESGITDLSTKNKDNVVLYSKKNNKFELVNLKKTDIISKSAEGSVHMAKTAAAGADSPLEVDLKAFSPEEIFDGYIIASTGGNDLSAGLNALRNWEQAPVAGSQSLKVCAYNNKDIAPIINSTLRIIISRTFYIAKNGDAFALDINDNGVLTPTFATENSRMAVFHEEADTLYLAKLAEGLNIVGGCIGGKPANLVIVIPDTITNIDDSGKYGFVGTDGLYFLGNTDKIIDLSNFETAFDRWNVQGSDIFDLFWSMAHAGQTFDADKYVRDCWENGLTISPVVYLTKKSGENNYSDINYAIAWATQYTQVTGYPATIILTDPTFEIISDVTIPASVTLKIPYGKGSTDTGRNFITRINYVGTTAGNSGQTETYTDINGNEHTVTHYDNDTYIPGTIADDDLKGSEGYAYENQTFKQFELKIAEGVTVTVNGTLEVGGTLAYVRESDSDTAGKQSWQLNRAASDPYYMGCVGGNYGQIINNGTLNITAAGALEVNGYVKGTGSVNALKGSVVLEPLVITDFSGGGNTATLLSNSVFPFTRYALPSITNITASYGAVLKVHAGVRQANNTNQVMSLPEIFVGYGNAEENNGLIKLNDETSSIQIQYKLDKTVKDENKQNNLAGDIGINKVTLNGEISIESFDLLKKVADMLSTGSKSNSFAFPIPYNFEYEINGTFNIHEKYIVLPGAKITVNKGGVLNVTAGSEFGIADCLEQNFTNNSATAANSKKYPTSAQLKTAGLDVNGVVTLNGGTLQIGDGAKAGGVINVTTNGGKVIVGTAVDTNGRFTFGANDGVRNIVNYNSPLRVYTATDNFTELKAGKTYNLTHTGTASVEVKCAYIYNKDSGFNNGDTQLSAETEDYTKFGCTPIEKWYWYLHTETISVSTCTIS